MVRRLGATTDGARGRLDHQRHQRRSAGGGPPARLPGGPLSPAGRADPATAAAPGARTGRHHSRPALSRSASARTTDCHPSASRRMPKRAFLRHPVAGQCAGARQCDGARGAPRRGRPRHGEHARASGGPEVASAPPLASAPASASLEDAMRDHLLAALEQTRWNIADRCGLDISRNTVRARIERFGLRPSTGSKADRVRSSERCDVRLDLRYALMLLGEFRRVFEYLLEAGELAESVNDQRRLGRWARRPISVGGYGMRTSPLIEKLSGRANQHPRTAEH